MVDVTNLCYLSETAISQEYRQIDVMQNGEVKNTLRKDVYAEENGKTMRYSEVDGTWTAQEFSNTLEYLFEGMGSQIAMFQEAYEFVRFDGDEFVRFDGDEFYAEEVQVSNKTLYNFHIRFEGEYISSIYYEMREAQYSGWMRMSFTDYNCVRVEIPKMEENGGESGGENTGLTREEWDAYFANTNSANNYTYDLNQRLEMNGSVLDGVGTCIITENAFMQINDQTITAPDGTVQYMVGTDVLSYEDGVWMYYSLVDGVWTKQVMENEDRLADILSGLKVGGALSMFQDIFGYGYFDEETQTFYADNYPVTEVATMRNVQIRFENGYIAYVSYNVETGEGTNTIEISIYDYNCSKVDIPTVDENGGEEGGDVEEIPEPTQDEWELAFNEVIEGGNYSYIATMSSYNFEHDHTSNQVKELHFDGWKGYGDSNGSIIYVWYNENDGKTYYFEMENGVWVKTEAPQTFEQFKYNYTNIFSMLRDVYRLLTWDAEKGGFYGENLRFVPYNMEREITLDSLFVKIENGHLTRIDYVQTTETGRAQASYELFNHNNTEVVLPKVDEENGEETVEIDEETWNAYFDNTMAQTNYNWNQEHWSAYNDGREYRVIANCDITETALTQNVQQSVRNVEGVWTEYYQNDIYTEVDGVSVRYSLKDGVWVMSESQGSIAQALANFSAQIGSFKDAFALVSWDAERGGFCAESYVVSGEGVEVKNLLIIFENGFVQTISYEMETEEYFAAMKFVLTKFGEVDEIQIPVIEETYTLQNLAEDYAEGMLEQARINAGGQTGEFEIVVLGKEETLAYIDMYTFSENLDKSQIVGGIFVKFVATLETGEVLYTAYYNFGLQFESAQSEAIEVTYDGSEFWQLEVVEENNTILFEYSIA